MKTDRAPICNEALAAILGNEPNPMESLVDDQSSARGVWTIGVANADLLKDGRVVKLACGHFTLTKSLKKARCARCGEMIRVGYDYDAFRNHGAPDDFSWPADPFLEIHESSGDEVSKWSPI